MRSGRRRSGRAGDPELTVFASPLGPGVGGAVRTIEAWAAAGATRVVLEPAEDEPNPEGFVRIAAQSAAQVAPTVG